MRKQVLETCLCEVNFNYQDLFSINSSWESILFLVTAVQTKLASLPDL